MAQIKVSELPESLGMQDDDFIYAIVDGQSRKIKKSTFIEDVENYIPNHLAKKIYVSPEAVSGGDGSYNRPFNTMAQAVAQMALVPPPASISVLPGDHYTNGNLPIPDGCSVVSTNGQYVTNIIMNAGYEQTNAILVGSGCYVQGLAFKNLQVDNFDDPTVGFAVAFRPGATIRRSPYIRDCSQISNYDGESIAPPLNPLNSLGGITDLGGDDFPNPLVGRGGGMLLADRAVLNQNSIFPYMLAFGATPRSPNGIGYVAKNGAGINGIGSLTIFQRCAFYALNGGQVTLNNSGTQFGDISLRAKGTTEILDPYETDENNLIQSQSFSQDIDTATDDIINDMWYYLESQGLSIDEIKTRRDAAYWLKSISYDFLTGDQTSSRNFIAGMFNYRGELVFDPEGEVSLTSFDESKCSRDVGLIVNAVLYDIMLDTNFRSIVAGRSYLRSTAGEVLSNQLNITVIAIEQLKQELLARTTGGGSQFITTKIISLLNLTLQIITEGENAIPKISMPLPVSLTAPETEAVNQLVNNKLFIISEVNQFIENTYPDLEFDQDKCSRDTGYILDGLQFDLTYGGNLESTISGNAYYVGTSLQISEEKTETLAAYTFMRGLIEAIQLDQDVVELQSNVPQTRGIATDQSNVNITKTLVNVVINIITNRTPPTLALPDISTVSSALVDFNNLINTELSDIQQSVVDYASTQLALPAYNQTKCLRDCLLITDAVAYDLMFGSNHRSITAALSYYRANASVVLAEQKFQTVIALKKQQELSVAYLSGIALSRAQELFTTIIDIINNGVSTSPNRVSADPVGYDVGFADSRRLLVSNKAFIQDEMDAWIISQIDNDTAPFESSNKFSYNSSLCRRDVGLIVDAVSFDVLLGSNYQSRVAAEAYLRTTASVVTGIQKTATLRALEKLKDILLQSVNGNRLATDRVKNRMSIVIDVITLGMSLLPSVIFPIPSSGLNNASSELVLNARHLLTENTGFIQAETIQYLTDNYPSLSYNQTTCASDIEKIVDALYYDLTYGGNSASRTAGSSYYTGAGVIQLGAGEKTATIAAYTFMKTVISNIVTSTVISPIQTSVNQILGASGSAAIGTRTITLMNMIVSTIDTGTTVARTLPDVTWIDSTIVYHWNKVQDNKNDTQDSVINFIDDNIVYGFQKSACRRDIGFIVDALEYDLTYGGNLETYTAASAYWVNAQSQLGDSEKAQTLATYTYLKQVVNSVAQLASVTLSTGNSTVQDTSGTAGSAAGRTFAEARIQEIYDVIDTDGTLPTKIIPDESWVSTDLVSAKTLLITNDNVVGNAVTATVDYITGNLLGAFLSSYYRMRDFIVYNLSPSQAELAMLDALIDDIHVDTLVDPNTLTFGSLIESIGHQFNLAGAGTNRNALPLNFRRVGTPLDASGSVLQEGGGRVRWSGADELNNQYFARGLKINGRTGKLEGRPFTSSVRRLARRAANSRTSL